MKALPFCLAFAVICGLGCKSAKVTSQRDFNSPAAGKPAIVYVADFELGTYSIEHEAGVLSGRPGPVGKIGNRLAGSSEDPAVRARQLVELMSESLVKELNKAGFSARRVQPGEPVPTAGWLVRGVFTEVQEGNRLRRAMVGFGQGQTDIQVITTIDDLSQGPPKRLYEISTDATSGQKPGAAPMLVLSPYGAPVRFVMAGKDLEKNVKETATRIAEQMGKRINETQPQ